MLRLDDFAHATPLRRVKNLSVSVAFRLLIRCEREAGPQHFVRPNVTKCFFNTRGCEISL